MASSVTLAITGITIGSQILTATTDTFCGLSGQDSIARAVLAPLDSTSGLLIFLALLHYFDFIRDGLVLNLPRWNLLHTTAGMQRAPNVEFAIRTDWRQIEKPTRIAHIRWREATNQNAIDFEVIPNTSLFMVPYMRARVHPQQHGANLPQYQVTMSRVSVENAAAQSFSRFLTVVTWSAIISIAHNVILWFYVPSWWLYLALAFAGFGRFLITIFQQSSIFTYSCHYKGVYTWACPGTRFNTWVWDNARQQAFSASVWTHLGWNYPAKAFYLLLELLWARAISWIVPSQKRNEPIYSNFQTPSADEFANAQGRLEVRIAERTTTTVRDLYDIHFLNVPESVKLSLQRPLIPSDFEMRLFGGSTAIPTFFGIFEPVVVGVLNAEPVPKALYLIEQLVVALFRYYDFSDRSVNTKIGDEHIAAPVPVVQQAAHP
ncbi:hypothetical protein BDW74DRAFT_172669 [Aspergillus multicolor]|uniref:uncharacterized protein n=1 Tax=Aspergillus multicolor TaxID=41759 RepID=UPI003CCDE342